MKRIFRSAAVYNITGGFLIIFLLDKIGPFVDFTNPGSMLFRLFVGGTAITFRSIYLSDKQPILFGKNPQKPAFSEKILGIPEERKYKG